MYSGAGAGTMCLTKAHAGTDPGFIRTKAQPDGEGGYRLSGSKMFIDEEAPIFQVADYGLPGTPPLYVGMCHLYCESLETFQQSFGPHAETVSRDIITLT